MNGPGRALTLAAIVSAISGCGAGAGGLAVTAANCTATGTPGASLSWDDDGVFQCAYSVYVTSMTSPTVALLSVTAAEPSGLGLGFGVTTPGAPIDGPYTCTPTATAQVTFDYQQGSAATLSSDCAISFDVPADGGTHVSGTFSGVFNLTSGATKTLTNGIFDAPVILVTP